MTRPNRLSRDFLKIGDEADPEFGPLKVGEDRCRAAFVTWLLEGWQVPEGGATVELAPVELTEEEHLRAIALQLTAVVTGSSTTQLSSDRVALDTVLQVAGIVLISALGLMWLRRLWRRRRNPDEPGPVPAPGPAA